LLQGTNVSKTKIFQVSMALFQMKSQYVQLLSGRHTLVTSHGKFPSEWLQRTMMVPRFSLVIGACYHPETYLRNQNAKKNGMLSKANRKISDDNAHQFMEQSIDNSRSDVLSTFKNVVVPRFAPLTHLREDAKTTTELRNQSPGQRKQYLCGLYFQAQWDAKFQQLVAYYKLTRNCRPNRNSALGSWVIHQRRLQRQGTLLEERLLKLNNEAGEWGFVGPSPFLWDASAFMGGQRDDSLWNAKLDDYVNFLEENGQYATEPKHLIHWIDLQRKLQKKGKLLEDRKERLEEVGFCFDRHELSWDVAFEHLIHFQRVTGHCNVPVGYSMEHLFKSGESYNLGKWAKRQRCGESNLDGRRKSRLKAIGFNLQAQAYTSQTTPAPKQSANPLR